MKLKDIYRPDAVTIDPDHDLAAAARRMELAQVGALAVVEQAGRLVGIFTERDLVRAIARSAANPADVWVSAHASFRPETAHVEEDSRDVARPMLERMKLKDIYRPDAVTVDPDEDLATAARRMLELGVRQLPVTVGDDQLVGMVSMRDLLAVEAWM
jgi:CBS domain-containing protein